MEIEHIIYLDEDRLEVIAEIDIDITGDEDGGEIVINEIEIESIDYNTDDGHVLEMDVKKMSEEIKKHYKEIIKKDFEKNHDFNEVLARYEEYHEPDWEEIINSRNEARAEAFYARNGL